MGRGQAGKHRKPRPAPKRPPRNRQIAVKNKGVRQWLLIGMVQGFIPRAGELLADLAKPVAVWLIGYLTGLLMWVVAAVVSYWDGF